MEQSKKMEDDFEVSIWDGDNTVCCVRTLDHPFIFAKIRKSLDDSRYVIYVGNKYVGFSRNFDSALTKCKMKLREYFRKEGLK